MKKIIMIIFVFIPLILIISCRQIVGLSSYKQLKFKIDDIAGFRLAGIDIGSKKSYTDFQLDEIAKVGSVFRIQKIPVDFIVKLKVINPNDGNSSSLKTDILLSKLDWKLFIDGKETLTGIMATPVNISPNEHGMLIPLKISGDLYQFIGNSGLENAINTLMAIGGINHTRSRIKLDVLPTIQIASAEITYPERIIVVDKEFN